MDLTYNPGELDIKYMQKESSSDMKRDHDSVDDFEHLDPESSPVDILSKPLIEMDSKSGIPTTSVKMDYSDFAGQNVNTQITKPEHSSSDSSITNIKDKPTAINVDSEQPQSNSELHLNTNSMTTEINQESFKLSPMHPEDIQFDNALNSTFISAEKISNSVNPDSESKLVGLKSNFKEIEEGHYDTPKSLRDDAEFNIPVKSMKEADAMSHYEIKLEKKETGKKDSSTVEEVVELSLPKLDPTKELNNPQTLSEDDLTTHRPSNDFVAVDSDNTKGHQDADKRDDILKGVQESNPLMKESQSTEKLPDEKCEEFEELPPVDDIVKHRVCICPSKPESTVSYLDDIIGPEDLFKRIGLDAWFTPGRLHPTVEALVYWRDPKKSGVVFGGVMAILLSICYMSLISVVGHFTFFVVTGAICFRIYKNILQAIQKTSGEGHPFKDYLEVDLSLPQDKVREIADTAVVHINAALVELRRLVLVEDLIDSVKFALCMWCLTYVGAIFNGMTLVILAFVALFTVPKIYENNKANIDMYIEMGRSKVAEITSKVKAAVPIGKKEPEKDKEQ